jgi:hypothetical protein
MRVRAKAKPVKSLVNRKIFSEAGVAAKAFMARGPRKLADGHAEAVDDGYARVTTAQLKKALPESFFVFPEVGRLAGMSNADACAISTLNT